MATTEYVFVNVFDATLYPELSAEVQQEMEKKVNEMRVFMSKMKFGVRHMRSTVTVEGVTYTFSLKLEQ